MLRVPLLLSALIAPLSAVVVSGGDGNNDNWWREGQTAPWSFGVLDADGDGKVSAHEFAEAQNSCRLRSKKLNPA